MDNFESILQQIDLKELVTSDKHSSLAISGAFTLLKENPEAAFQLVYRSDDYLVGVMGVIREMFKGPIEDRLKSDTVQQLLEIREEKRFGEYLKSFSPDIQVAVLNYDQNNR